MKIYYITNVRFPTEKAHGWQIAKMCDAFSNLGHDVELVIPDRQTPIAQSPTDYYELKHAFKITRLPVFDALAVPWIPRILAFAIFELTFIRAVRRWKLRVSSPDQALVITRDQFLAPRLVRLGWKIIFEAHDVSPRFFWLHKNLAKILDLIVASNEWKKQEIIKRWAANIKGQVMTLHNGIDLEPYKQMLPRDQARAKLNWSLSEKIALYTGHLYDWKGVYVLADASAFLPSGYKVVLLGGTSEDNDKMRKYLINKGLTRIELMPCVAHKDVLVYLAAADCFVLPNSAKSWNSMYTTSPIKLWEYLAAQKPVVASDLPSLREMVTDREVLFVRPDDPKFLADGIISACQDNFDNSDRVMNGWQRVWRQTWLARAKKLMKALI